MTAKFCREREDRQGVGGGGGVGGGEVMTAVLKNRLVTVAVAMMIALR